MSLHWGYLAVAAPGPALLEQLSRHAGEFTVDSVGGFHLMTGERDGVSFVLDTSMVLSDSPDIIVAMSAELGTVVGAGAESGSGTYWLTVARDGKLLRYIHESHTNLTLGLAVGDPLPSEREFPLDDPTGDGVRAALAVFGLDPSPWLESGPATIVGFDPARLPPGGPITAVRARHFELHRRPVAGLPAEVPAAEGRHAR